MSRMKRPSLWLSLLLAATLAGCAGEKALPGDNASSGTLDPVIEEPAEEPAPGPEPAVQSPGDIEVKAVYDEQSAAIRFSWKSHEKTFPGISFANYGLVYPGQYHDLLTFNGTVFVREPVEDHRFNEDRVALMLEDPSRPVAGFDKAGCYISCHAGMTNHRLAAGSLDFWHWRGQRSGPMGYAEDTWLSTVQRERDARGTAPSAWITAAGDRLREDQPVLANTNHDAAEGLPRFVFNKGKQMPGGFTVPSYFLSLENGGLVTQPFAQLPLLKDVAQNRTLLVVFQDRNFDPVDKVNAIDVGYLVFVAKDRTNQLPAHLQNRSGAAFAAWTTFWSQELGIAADPGSAAAVAAAEALLAEIRGELGTIQAPVTASIARSVAFIYNSDQHHITSTRSFDPVRGIWTVALFRNLDTGSSNDTSLAGLGTGVVYNLGFAIHDIGDAHESHHVSLPYRLGNASSAAEIKAIPVADVKAADWTAVPGFLTRVFAADEKTLAGSPNLVTFTELSNPALHLGAGQIGAKRCQECHAPGLFKVLNP